MTDQKRIPFGSTAFVRMGALAICAVVALFVRTYFLYGDCLPGDYVSFLGTDAWYHVRTIENLVHQFPHRLTFDPYALHPAGQHVAVAPLYDLMVAAVAWLVGWGAPSTEVIHATCAWFPPIVGAMMTIPIYSFGKMVHSHHTGLAMAAVLAVLPGPFLQRTLLASTDHHAAECLWSLLTLLFLLRSLGPMDGLSSSPKFSVRALRVLPASLCLGCYLLSWVGGSLFVLMLFLAFVFYVVVKHARGGSAAEICFLAALLFSLPLMIVIPFRFVPLFEYHIASLVGAAVFFALTGQVANTLRARDWPRAMFPIAIGVLAVVGLVLLRIVTPAIFDQARAAVLRFVAGQDRGQVGEALPLLYANGEFTLSPLWKMFNVNCGVAVLGFVGLAYAAIRHGSPSASFIVVWTIFMAVATLYQRRFGYYLAINVAVLAGYAWGQTLDYMAKRVWSLRGVGAVAFVLLGLGPNVPQLLKDADAYAGPAPDWHHALSWLRQNSPEPFGDDAMYYARYETQPAKGYGIMCWWDCGYWITQMAHRIPTSNPTQAGAVQSAEFLIAQDEASANLIMANLGARYVILDGSLPVWENTDTKRLIGKFHNIIKWAGGDPDDYFETYRLPNEDGTYKWKTFYYPKYYRSMLTRLYIFAGEGFVPNQSTYAVAFTTTVDSEDRVVKTIMQAMRFVDYETAQEFVAQQSDPNWRIVGNSHALSCVRLAPLRRCQLIYKSPTTVAQTSTEQISHVEIFQWLQESDAQGQS